MAFQAGNVVQLKSGGPRMTITGLGTAGGKESAWCAWFEGTENRSAVFPIEAIELAPELKPMRTR
jgi:uncharacterized protein YodC (DUF2158 family)